MKLVVDVNETVLAAFDASIAGTFATRSEAIRFLLMQYSQRGSVGVPIAPVTVQPAVAVQQPAKPPEPVQLTRFTTICGACHIGDHAACDQNKLPIICPCPCDGGKNPIAPKPRTKLVPLGNGLVLSLIHI